MITKEELESVVNANPQDPKSAAIYVGLFTKVVVSMTNNLERIADNLERIADNLDQDEQEQHDTAQEPEPIPAGIRISPSGNFIDGNGQIMNVEFRKKWNARRSEFPR